MTSVTFKTLFIVAILFVVTVYSLLPHYIRYDTLKDQGAQYIPLTRESYFDVMNVHGARYREIVDGNVFAGDVDTYEYKDGPSLWPPLSASLLAPFFIPFDTIFPGFIITDLLFPVFIFLGFFFLIRTLTQNKWFSLASAGVLMLFPQLPTLVPPSSFTELKILVSTFLPPPVGSIGLDLTYLGRESFIPGAPFFLGFLYFVLRSSMEGLGRKVFWVFGGIFYGLLFYLYFYYWVFATIFLGLFLLALFITKRNNAAKSIAVSTLIGAVISTPFWLNHHELSKLPHYHELVSQMGLEIGHGIKWFLWKTYLLFAVLVVFSAWLSRRLEKPSVGLFLAVLALAGIIALNANILIGFTPQSDHWSGRVFLITNGVIFSVLLYYVYLLLQKHTIIQKCHKAIVVVIVIAVVLLAGNVAYKSILTNKKNAHVYTVPASLTKAYGWLNANTPKNSVVLTPAQKTNIDIPVYTHNRIFMARAQTSLAPEREILERFYFAHALFGISLKQFDEIIQSSDAVFYLFTARYQNTALDAYLRPRNYEDDGLPHEKYKEMMQAYSEIEALHTFPYRADYLFVGPHERTLEIEEKNFNRYEAVYRGGEVTIYRYGEN